MNAVIWTKPDCQYCDMAKILLAKREANVEAKMLDVDFTREDLKKAIPWAKSFPQIYIDDQYVGGYEDLVKWFKLND